MARTKVKENKKKVITEYFSKKNEQIDTPTLIKEIEHVNISNSIPDTILVEANLKPKGKTPYKKLKTTKSVENGEINVKYSIRHTRFEKDCFKGNWSSTYFLSHFHSDHTSGLGKSFKKGIIYATQTTCNLAMHKYNLPPTSFHIVDIGKTYYFTNCKGEHFENVQVWLLEHTPSQDITSRGLIQTKDASDTDEERVVRVDVLDANHCPGACLFLFTLYRWQGFSGNPFFTALYTGDFRYTPGLIDNTLLNEYTHASANKLDLIYLDNTYVEKALELPSQEMVIHTIITTLDKFWGTLLRTRPYKVGVFVGSYSIGKEKVWLAIARQFGVKVYLTEEQLSRVRCYEEFEHEYLPFITNDPAESPVRVIPLCRSARHVAALNMHRQYERVIAIMPTGWEMERLKDVKNKEDPTLCNYTFYKTENIIAQGYPYSEHCSFNEVKAFLSRLRFNEIEFIVETDNENALRKKLGCNRIFFVCFH